jgi:ATP-dependent 26S proteasome regulatory subunit
MDRNPFIDLEVNPRDHFNVCFYGAVLHLIGSLTRSMDSFEEVFNKFPFLAGYSEEIASRGVAGQSVEDAEVWWQKSMLAWENRSGAHLPLRALRDAAQLDHQTLLSFLIAGIAEEDSRFGEVFELMQRTSGHRRPSYGLLKSWFHQAEDESDIGAPLQRLINLGLVHVANPTDSRSEWLLQVPVPLWDALRGNHETLPASWMTYSPPQSLERLQDLILPDDLGLQLTEISQALASGKAKGIIVRGPRRNGKRTAVKGIARSLSRGVLEIVGLEKTDDERWKIVGPLATALNAIPLVVVELSPGQTLDVPRLSAYDGPTALVLGRQGGISGTWAEQSIAIHLDTPGSAERKAHWFAGTGTSDVGDCDVVAERYRMTRGNIRRAAAITSSYAEMKHHTAIRMDEAQQAIRTLSHEVLDGLAERVDTFGDWSHLSTAPHTFDELQGLERRCRHRENLHTAVNPVLGMQLSSGVRALFSGPSGTGKTLAARLLAASLRLDLYRINLANVVNKYIGETEKNLNLVLSRAEELPVMLLLDEGDALLTHRTDVQTSNDRYANLETDFLLQRLESFNGIIIITTNAGDRIDSAFLRRMDVVIDFRSPDPGERWNLWTMFLPTTHTVDPELLAEIASRCAMTGGQIRNAILHASLLALSNGGIVVSEYLESAVRREYRKSGVVCPLRRTSTSSISRE